MLGGKQFTLMQSGVASKILMYILKKNPAVNGICKKTR